MIGGRPLTAATDRTSCRYDAIVQKQYAELWANLDPDALVQRTSTIEEALDRLHELGSSHACVQVFATGSLHLISGLLGFLTKNH
jgi:hypothetical protein